MECKTVSKQSMSSECFMVQAVGTKKCETCEYKNTKECGGKEILRTGKNENGVVIGITGMEE